MDYTAHGILQARIWEWVAFPFSRASSQPRDRTQVSHIACGFFNIWAMREALYAEYILWNAGLDKAQAGIKTAGRNINNLRYAGDTTLMGERKEEMKTTEDEMAGWHHRLDGYEFEQTPGVGDGQGGLACCDSWGRKELDTTERLNWTKLKH